MTDSEFLYRAAFAPGMMVTFLEDPENMSRVVHFTPHDEVDIYDEVNPGIRPALQQEGKVVAITGAGRGVGRATALMFARAKAGAIGICSRSMDELVDCRDEVLRTSPDTLVHIQAVDVSVEKDVSSFFENMAQKLGAIDIVVSNAGANSCFQSLENTDTDEWWQDVVGETLKHPFCERDAEIAEMQTVNLRGTYLVSKYFLRHMNGRIGTFINVSSCHALAAVPGQTAYCTSKLAALRLMEIVHLENRNLRVFSVHPGAVNTQLLHELQRKMGGLELHWRWTDPKLTGATILWLTTDSAEFLRGRWISVNWRVDEIKAMEESIVADTMLKLAFSATLGG